MTIRHGHTRKGGKRTPTYGSWRAMVYRCNSPSDSSYKDYGAKGVTVCARWLETEGRGFLNFLADMGQRPEGETIDRIDNTKGYEPGNCRWATRLVQQNNRSTTRFIEYDGRRQSLGAWAHETGIPFGTLFQRVKAGWSPERALTEPVHQLGY